MRSGLLSEGFGKALHKVLKNITAVYGADFVWAQVTLGRIEFFDDQIQAVALHHAADDVVKVELGQYILHIAGESGQIIPEVCLDIVRIGQQTFKGKAADIVELVAGGTGQEAVNNCQLLDLFVLLDYRAMGGSKQSWNRLTTVIGKITRPYS